MFFRDYSQRSATKKEAARPTRRAAAKPARKVKAARARSPNSASRTPVHQVAAPKIRLRYLLLLICLSVIAYWLAEPIWRFLTGPVSYAARQTLHYLAWLITGCFDFCAWIFNAALKLYRRFYAYFVIPAPDLNIVFTTPPEF